MGDRSPPVLVFSSARAGSSFEVWLFRKLTPEARRLALAFATASLPRWEASVAPGQGQAGAAPWPRSLRAPRDLQQGGAATAGGAACAA